jgi:hypothetical protein
MSVRPLAIVYRTQKHYKNGIERLMVRRGKYTHEMKATELKKQGKSLVCNLVMDEMSIKRHIQWNGSKQLGYIDYGFQMEGERLPEAKEVIVFLLVALNCKSKISYNKFKKKGLSCSGFLGIGGPILARVRTL